LVNEWSRSEGHEPQQLTGVQALDKLALADRKIIQEWKRQAIWIRALHAHVQKCAKEKKEEEFVRDYKITHENRWGRKLKVVGVPKEGTEGMEEYRSVVVKHKVQGELLEELKKVLLRDYPVNALLPRGVARWLSLKVEAFMGVDPNRLHCFYKNKEPDLDHSRKVVFARRIQALVALLGTCMVGGELNIPEEARRQFKEEYPHARFLGSTLAGLNQVVAGELMLGDGTAEFDGKIHPSDFILTDKMLYAYCKTEGKSSMWAMVYGSLKPSGTTHLMQRKAVTDEAKIKRWREETDARAKNMEDITDYVRKINGW